MLNHVTSTPFKILWQDENLVAIDKPQGFHVHQPEFPRRRVPREQTCLYVLREQIDQYLFPVHRIDAGTEGVLLFALNKASAGDLCRQFQDGHIKKSYFAMARGWMADEGVIDIPLELDSTGVAVPSVTRFKSYARVEIPNAVGKKHATSRYALVQAWPETGRFHQVRRHLARTSHPLIGDAMHGDSHHNRYFREQLGLGGLWLKARAIEFVHPVTGERTLIESEWTERWQNLFAKFAIKPPEAQGVL